MFRAIHRTFSNFRAHRGFFLASGLSFSLLTCLIPILFFVVSLAGFVLSRRAAMDAVLGQLAEFVPVYKNELRQALEQIIRKRNLSGLVGTGILLLFASQLFGSVRVVLNDIFFGVGGGPGIVRGMLKDVFLLFLMGVLFLGSIVVTDLFGWLKIILLTPIQVPPEWVQSVFIGLALAMNTALFFIAYRYFPHRKIPAGAALAGALLAAVLWETAKQLFRWYILSMGVYDKVYGPLGALVALSMFVYYSGVIFILGAEFTAALVNGRSRA